MPKLTWPSCLLAALVALSGCSTDYWYTQFQSSQFYKCDKLAGAEDRRRCQAETRVDKDGYDKERKAAAGKPV